MDGQVDLGPAVVAATRRLAAAGVPSPRHDAESLAAHVLGVPRGQLRTRTQIDADAFERLVARREAREPLQHIVGSAAFRFVELVVGPGVFIPRPETETVAGWGIDRAREARSADGPLVVDLCTGSGAIALAVSTEVPGARVHAVELSTDALDYARRNLAGSGVALHGGDAATALPELDGLVDVVIANPPYIPDDGRVRDVEVLEHDPPLALWGHGPDGLDVMRGVAGAAQRLLRPGGWFVVEHADVQGPGVVALLTDQGGWTQVRDHQDLAGRDRFASAQKGNP
jgi:release factor glutamine methyltransferase